MKKFLVVLLFLFLALHAFSQEEPEQRTKYPIPEYAYGDFSLSGSANLLCNTPNGIQLAGGFKMNSYLCPWVSLESDMVIGRDYFHFGPGIIGIPLWLLMTKSGGFVLEYPDIIWQSFILLLTAEHIAGHIPVGDIIDVSPYMSWMRIKYQWDRVYGSMSEYESNQVDCAFGIRVNKYFNQFFISPYAEISIGYTDRITAYNFGIYCGYYFYGK